MRFIWGVACVGFAVVFCLMLVLLKSQVADALYVMLSGSVVAAAFVAISVVRGDSAAYATRLLFFALVGSIAAWVLGQILCWITARWFIGEAALAYDLLMGVLGATTVACLLLDTSRRGEHL